VFPPEKVPQLRQLLLKIPVQPERGSVPLGDAKVWQPWGPSSTDGVEADGGENAAAAIGYAPSEFFILDVRSEKEFQTKHLHGAVNIPIDDLGGQLAQVKGLAGERRVVVFCTGGMRAARAVHMLRNAGLANACSGHKDSTCSCTPASNVGGVAGSQPHAEASNATLEGKLQEVAAAWAPIDPRTFDGLKPRYDHWLDFWGSWEAGEGTTQSALGFLIADANLARIVATRGWDSAIDPRPFAEQFWSEQGNLGGPADATVINAEVAAKDTKAAFNLLEARWDELLTWLGTSPNVPEIHSQIDAWKAFQKEWKDAWIKPDDKLNSGDLTVAESNAISHGYVVPTMRIDPSTKAVSRDASETGKQTGRFSPPPTTPKAAATGPKAVVQPLPTPDFETRHATAVAIDKEAKGVEKKVADAAKDVKDAAKGFWEANKGTIIAAGAAVTAAAVAAAKILR
jgi:rhodanese-related sulfurtransferase